MIGEVLKEKRISKGIALEQVAADLKIRASFLKALEEEDFDIFPADVYTMGYIRNYAIYLGIEPGPLIEEFKALRERASQEISSQTLKLNKIKGMRLKANLLILGVILLVGGLTIYIFKSISSQQRFNLHQVTVEPLEAPQRSNDLLETFKEAPRSQVYTLKIIAHELSWLMVESEEGSHDITLRPGEAVQYTSTKGFKLKTGNAGGIKLILNGKEMEPLGKSGEVKVINLP